MLLENKLRKILGVLLIAMIASNAFAINGIISEPLSSKKISIGVMLNWSTSIEEETEFFIIEKSSNGEHFTQIGKVKGMGDVETGFEYSFVDLFPQEGTSYYRLKLMNDDGSFSFLEKITTKLIPETNFNISKFSTTSPSKNWSINLDVYKNGSIVFEWIGVKGAVLDEGIKRVKKGFNSMSFSMEDWPNGIYTLQMEMAGDKKNITIQKIGEATLQVGIEK